jgi:predicted GNAT superfamily acetyltransferase
MSSQPGPRNLPLQGGRGHAGTAEVLVEEIRSIAQAYEVEALQMEVWGANASWVAPAHVLHVVSDCGGILLGARVDGRLVGFVLGFLARREGKLFHASHMLGVLPSYQHHGIGAALKWHQRERALDQGLDLMTWTFDPLESRNAYFNLHKLGVISRKYHEDYYGAMPDALNQGLPSDRLLVEWHLSATVPKVNARITPAAILTERAGSPELRLGGVPASRPVTIHIPRDLQALKRNAPDDALSWRLAVRRAFRWALSRGYVAQDFADSAYLLLPSGRHAR